MATLGYIYMADESCSVTNSKLQSLCDYVFVDDEDNEIYRPQWRCLMEELTYGDTIIVSTFSNAFRGVREFAFFMDYCRRDKIRIISLIDKIDTENEMFPMRLPGEILQIIGMLPAEISQLRNRAAKKTAIYKRKLAAESLQRDKEIIRLYTSGMPPKDIMQKSHISRVTLYYILKKHNIATIHTKRKK